jgi:hypothetical protein
MTQLSRRFFLGGLLAVGAASTVTLAPLLPLRPQLWADGIHDDTKALNALFNGETVDILNDEVRLLSSETVTLSGGLFRVSNALRITRPKTIVYNCEFIRTVAARDDSCILIEGLAKHSSFTNIIFRSEDLEADFNHTAMFRLNDVVVTSPASS